MTIRYDQIDPHALDGVIEGLQRKGFRPYVVLDDWEVPVFRGRFSTSAAGHVDWKPLRDWGQVIAYDPLQR